MSRSPRVPGGGSRRLSPAQLRVREAALATGGRWPLQALALFEVDGELDLRRLRRGVSAVVARHEVLRTRPAADATLERCASGGAAEAVEIDLRRVGEAAARAEIRALVAARVRRPHPGGRPPELPGAGGSILTVLFFRRPDGQDLLVSLPAFAGDGAGVELLGHRILEACAGGPSEEPASEQPASEQPASEEPSVLRYTDVAEALRQLLESEETREGRDFWRRVSADGLSGELLPMELRPPGEDGRRSIVDLVETRLPAREAGSLEGLAAASSASAGELALAAWCVLLFRLGGPRRLTVGIEAGGRGFEGLEETLGPFARYVPLTVTLGHDLAFEDLLQRVRRRAAEVLPMSDFFSWDALSRDASTPQVEAGKSSPRRYLPYCFDWRQTPAEPRIRGGLRWRLRRERTAMDRFHLRLAGRLLARGEGCDLAFWYDARRYRRTPVRALAERFRRLLRSAGADPRRPIGELEILSPAERHLLLAEFSNTASPAADVPCAGVPAAGAPVIEAWRAQCRRAPSAVAVVDGDACWTCGELDRLAAAIGEDLWRRGAGREVAVGLLLAPGAEMVAAMLGVLAAGGFYVPLDPDHPRRRIRRLVVDAGAPLVLTLAAFLDKLRGVPATARCLDRRPGASASPAGAVETGDAPGGPPDQRPTPIASANLAYLIYTSGSTGRPKGVAVTHGGLAHLVAWHRRLHGLGGDDRTGQVAYPAFDASVLEIWPALVSGARLEIAGPELRRDPEAFRRWIGERRLTIALALTPMVEIWLARRRPLPPSLRVLLTGGEKLHRRPAEGGGPALVNHYGPAENTVVTTAAWVAPAPPGGELPAPAIGRPISRVQTWVVDRGLGPLPLGAAGELAIGGAGLARGYLRRPALTAERFVPDPFSGRPGSRLYRSGDRVRWQPNGELRFEGRLDHQVKVRGSRIELGEVEAALVALPGVREAVVAVREDLPGGRGLVGYVSVDGRPGENLRRDPRRDLRRGLRRSLPEIMVPAAWVVLPALPRTPGGKVDRRALPVPEPAAWGPPAADGAPRTPAEKVVAEVWSDVLGWPVPPVDADFFDLGGHSLLATRVVSRLRRVLEVELSVRDLFEAPTVAELAERVEAARRSAAGLAPAPEITPLPRAPGRHLPLSFAQQRMWFLAQLDPGSTAYSMPLTVRLDGPLEPAALAGALGEVVRRHEVLRTAFTAVDGQPASVIVPSRTALPRVELGGLPEPAARAEARRLAGEDARRPIDLARGPLLRTALVRLGPERHVLIANLHHAAGDEWSIRILAREIRELYAAASTGRPPALPALPVQYADYAAYQRALLESGLHERQLAYWKERLGDPQTLELPADRRRPPVRSARGAALAAALPPATSAGLAALARGHDATLFMTLMALFQLLLFRLGGRSDVAIGTPISGRDRLEVEDLIGFFLNTLVIRVRIEAPASFGDLVAEVRRASLEAYDHKDLPFEELVEAIEPERSLSRSPLFQVMFVLLHASPEPRSAGGLRWSTLPPSATTAKFDLTLALQAGPEAIAGSLEYSTDLFDRTTARRMVLAFETLAAAAVAGAGRPVADLDLLSVAERHQLLREWSPDTSGAVETPVVEAWREQCRRAPSAVAVVDGDACWTYSELDRLAAAIGEDLRRRGAGPEVAVGLLLTPGAEMVAAMLGVLAAGGFYVPLDPDHPRRRIRRLVADAGAPLVLTLPAFLDKLRGVPATPRCLGRRPGASASSAGAAETGNAPGGPPARRSTPGVRASLAYLVYTSGSTGRPKGVAVTHGGLAHLVAWHRRLHGLGGDDRMGQVAYPAFDASVLEIWPALVSGTRLEIAGPELRRDPEAFRRWIGERRLTIAFAPTPVVEIWLARRCPLPPSLRVLLTGGEKLHRRPAEGGRPALMNLYGPAENTVVATAAQIAPALTARERAPAIGRPIAGVHTWVADRGLKPLPLGAAGELAIGGAGLARGYLRRPALTAERFVPDPFSGRSGSRLYRSGDRVRWQPNGELRFEGRLDHQVKIRGSRIEVGEVEAALLALPGVREGVVVAWEDLPGGRGLVGYVSVDGRPGEGLRRDLRRGLRRTLPEVMVPAAWVVLPALPRTPGGKVDRRALPAPEPAAWGPPARGVAPRTPAEKVVAEVWSGVLGRPVSSVDDDFFDLGGHSLLATRVVSRLRRALEVELSVRDLFEAPTVAELAERAEVTGSSGSPRTAPGAALVALRASGRRTPLFFVHPGGGDVFPYVDLMRELGPEQPVYGFRSPGLEAPQAEPVEIETLASRYLAELRSVRRRGPYLLGGWSLGGAVAFEMARRLEKDGEPVPLLALLDTRVPASAWDERGLARPAEDETRKALRAFAADLGWKGDLPADCLTRWRAAPPERRFRKVFEIARAIDLVPSETRFEDFETRFRVFVAHRRALLSWRPGRYHGQLTLFLPDGEPPECAGVASGWRKWALGGVEVVSVPGDHHTMIRRPGARVVAGKLRALLEEKKLSRRA